MASLTVWGVWSIPSHPTKLQYKAPKAHCKRIQYGICYIWTPYDLSSQNWIVCSCVVPFPPRQQFEAKIGYLATFASSQKKSVIHEITRQSRQISTLPPSLMVFYWSLRQHSLCAQVVKWQEDEITSKKSVAGLLVMMIGKVGLLVMIGDMIFNLHPLPNFLRPIGKL